MNGNDHTSVTRGTASVASALSTESPRKPPSASIDHPTGVYLIVLNIPVLRWGKPYESLETDEVVHFATGEPIAHVSQANGGIIQRDMRKAQQARDILREIPSSNLIDRVKKAAELYVDGTLPMGDGTQSPDDFVHQQSASTGLPEHMCKANMAKNSFVLTHMSEILDCLTRGLPLDILTQGYGTEDRGVVVSYQAQSPVLGAVLPSNSPGVHTLWLPAIPLQLGLVLKPGPQEPWTPYRMVAAFRRSGHSGRGVRPVPRRSRCGCRGAHFLPTVDDLRRYRNGGTVSREPESPGARTRILEDPVGGRRRRSVGIVHRRDCGEHLHQQRTWMHQLLWCVGITSHQRNRRRVGRAIRDRSRFDRPMIAEAGLAAFTVPGVAKAVWEMIEADLKEEGVTHATAEHGPRLVEHERCAYLRPTIVHCSSPEAAIAKKEYMFPFSTVVECPQSEMLAKIGPTLVCSAITRDRHSSGN